MGLAGGEAGRQRGGIIVDTSAFSGDPHCISKELLGVWSSGWWKSGGECARPLPGGRGRAFLGTGVCL